MSGEPMFIIAEHEDYGRLLKTRSVAQLRGARMYYEMVAIPLVGTPTVYREYEMLGEELERRGETP